MHRWGRRRRRGRRGRPPIPVYIGQPPPLEALVPYPMEMAPPVALEPAEVEALRLVDLEGLSQEEAGARMGVSRGTVWRILHEARRKVAQALVEGRRIMIVR